LRITLLGEDALRCEPAVGPLTIESRRSDQVYSAFHMLASGLAVCTLAVLRAWASNANLEASRLALEVHWSFTEQPHRVAAYAIVVEWPGLETTRRDAALRVAETCGVKETLRVPPRIDVELRA
jgi:uncharacterized OsmC-like protein